MAQCCVSWSFLQPRAQIIFLSICCWPVGWLQNILLILLACLLSNGGGDSDLILVIGKVAACEITKTLFEFSTLVSSKFIKKCKVEWEKCWEKCNLKHAIVFGKLMGLSKLGSVNSSPWCSFWDVSEANCTSVSAWNMSQVQCHIQNYFFALHWRVCCLNCDKKITMTF